MKKLSLAMPCILALAGEHAHASPAMFHWTGLYLGGNIGGKWGSAGGPLTVDPVPSYPGDSVPFSANGSSLTGGAQIGYNWQRGTVVFGLEADVNAMNLNASQTLSSNGTAIFVIGDSFSAKSDWQSSLRARIGYAGWKNWLVYATGGVAFAGLNVSSNFITVTSGGIDFPASTGSDSKTLIGGTVGFGFERALNSRWSVGSEFRYAAYGPQTFSLGQVASYFNGTSFENGAARGRVTLNTTELLVKLNFKLN